MGEKELGYQAPVISSKESGTQQIEQFGAQQKVNTNLQKLKTEVDAAKLQLQLQHLKEKKITETMEQSKSDLEQIKLSTMFETTILEIEKSIQIKDKKERAQTLQPLLQRFRKNPLLRELLAQKIEAFEQAKQHKETPLLTTKKDIVTVQLYGNVFFDDTILVDGIVGQQTRDIQAAVTGQGQSTERAKQWQTTYTIKKEEKKKSDQKPEQSSSVEVQPLSQSLPPSGTTTLQHVDVQSLLTTNPSLKNWADTASSTLSPEKTQQAIEKVLSYVAQYLDITTKEQDNFLKDFSINTHKGISWDATKLHITGALKNTISPEGSLDYETPISFSYDIVSGAFAINTLLQTVSNQNAFNINASQANHHLFSLPPFAHLADTTMQISPNFKEEMEFNIEKNRAVAAAFHLFHLDDTLTTYTKTDNPWMYHLCNLLSNSLTTVDDCRMFRKAMFRLSTLIGSEMQEGKEFLDKDGQPLQSIHLDEEYGSDQQDQKLAEKSGLLYQLFNYKKRNEDRTLIGKPNDTENWLYLFLKRATPQISSLSSTASDEHQKVDIKEISTYLSFIEQGKEQQYTWFITRK